MSIKAFEKQKYINLETFRKTGEGVKTPVWFVEEDNTLYTRTVYDSWKVKRLKRNPRIKVVPSDSRGSELGTWQDGEAYVIEDADINAHINKLFNKKYGLLKRGFDLMGKVRGDKLITVRINVSEA